ncbi:MAG TPA: extracellular solute-binding protein [Acidimicrobiia bacterium]|nr:extracellular solute-binding protein [Acidimicrobiia bacterium]
MTLRVALVGGPMYDHLYESFAPGEVEVVVHADHPTLNRRIAELLAAGERIDVLATHAKYSPSQAQWLRPLDDLLDPAALAPLAPAAVAACRNGSALLCAPRLIDVRVLWVRADRVAHVPDSWAQLLDSEVVFGFPGRESGLFGTFFELVVGRGGRLFDDDQRPTMATPEAEAAVETLCALAARAPGDLVGWHYDDVDRALLDGRVDAAAAWPGGFGAIRASALAAQLRPHPYLAGPVRRVSYSGCHAWAIPRTCGDVDGAVALVTRLLGAQAQGVDAAGGNMCAHEAALAAFAAGAEDPVDRERLAITGATIRDAMIGYPQLSRFPEVEDAGWSAIRDALCGQCTPVAATHAIQQAAEKVLASE